MITNYTKATKYYQFFNANPTGEEVGDCSVRCVAVALNVSWLEAYDMMAAKAREMYRIMNEPPVVGAVLKDNGFKEMKVSVKKGSKRPTLMQLIKGNPNSIIVGQIASHFATARGGKVRDLWNSSERSLYRYWIKGE